MRDRLLAGRITATRKSVLLLGPRQVGKSTLCRSLGAELYLDLSDEGEYLGYAKDPARLRREVSALGPGALVVIDEVQRLPSILNSVQALIDESRGRRKFVLTGSSARKLKRGGANLLPGRIVLEHLDPLSILEVDEMDVRRGCRVGMLPGIFWGAGEEVDDVLETYAEVYLREEIQAEALTRNLGGYARFLDTMAQMSGQWINYSKVASDAEIPKETVRRFVRLLEDTLLAVVLSPFRPARSTSRRLLQRERVLLFDVGVRNALLGIHRHGPSADQIGGVFEQWVILQIHYLNRALRKGWKLSSYRTEAGAEVDVVIQRGSDIIAIEVKHGRNLSSADTRGLTSLAEVVGRKQRLESWILYRGERKQRFDSGVEAWPVLDGLRALAESAPLDRQGSPLRDHRA